MAGRTKANSREKRKDKKAVKKRRSVGRPRKYTASQAQKLIDNYFQTCSDTKKPFSITGLALALDTSRKVLCEWTERGDDLGNAVKKAKDRVENYVEELLLTSSHAAGSIFWLKNFGWTDRQTIDLGGEVKVSDPGREKLTDEELAKFIADLKNRGDTEEDSS